MEQNLSDEDVKKIISDHKMEHGDPFVKNIGGGLYSLKGITFGKHFLSEFDKNMKESLRFHNAQKKWK